MATPTRATPTLPHLRLGAVAMAGGLLATLPPPPTLDAALFGALGGLLAAAMVAPMGPALFALSPLCTDPAPVVPAAAPSHVLALLAGGAADNSTSMPAPAWAGAASIGLGGL